MATNGTQAATAILIFVLTGDFLIGGGGGGGVGGGNEDEDSVGTEASWSCSSLREQPLLAVSAAGHSTCSKLTLLHVSVNMENVGNFADNVSYFGFWASENQLNRQRQPSLSSGAK